MKRYPGNRFTACRLLFLALAASLALPLPAQAASVALATSPLATSTTTTVKPNVLLVIDNSGSMAWDHMPDDSSDAGSAVTFSFGYYGLRSSQCNQVYYDPAITYLPPLHADGTSYSNASFTGAWTDGYNTSAGTVDLSSGFRASLSLNADSTGQSAYYYLYSGAQTSSLQKNYNSTTNTFYSECHSAQNASPGNTVFSKRRLNNAETTTITVSGTGGTSSPYASVSGITVNGTQTMNAASTTASGISSSTMATNIAARITLNGFSATASGSTVTITGPTSAANYTPVISTTGGMGSITLAADVFPDTTASKLTNFANWYSYYRYRMLMMKTATGRAFGNLNKNYRVGMMKISSSTPVSYADTFWDNSDTSLGPVSTHRTDWYDALYALAESGSTPLRTALSNAGRYYAGKLYTIDSTHPDPLQYSCQQNFTILSTDGYWNTGDGYKLNGSTTMDNEDGTLSRPFYDGSTIGLERSTSQRQQTQTQVRQSTSQLQKRTQQIQSSTSRLQSSTSNLQSSTSTLQSSTMYLYKSTNSGGSWSTAASCTWGGTTQCKYGKSSSSSTTWTSANGTWSNAASCTTSFSTNTTAGTTWTGNGTNCQYTAYTTPANASSCTQVDQSTGPAYTVGTARNCTYTAYTTPANASSCTQVDQSSGSPYTVGTATNCTYAAYSSWANASSCTTVPPSGGSPYTVGTATQCQVTDSGWGAADPQLQTRTSSDSGATWTAWSNAASCTADSSGSNQRQCQTTSTCTPSSSGGQTVTCQSNTTGPTLVASCTPVSASSANGYTDTTCATTTVSAATPVASCTDVTATASNGWITTTCNTVSTGPTAGSCTAAAASASNNWTTTTCSQVVTGGGTSNTLADVAMYYYQTDLRTSTLGNCTGTAGADVCDNNVFTAGDDRNLQQHMTTFTLGLGASGWMNYSSSYLSDTTGDYISVKNGSTANSAATPPVCSWQANGTACGWPTPGMDSNSNGYIANIDDLWHAAVNGHGAYFSATNPSSLSDGLSNALAGINARKGSAAAAATSTLNPVAGNNFAYVASYTTVTWKGNLEARGINTDTGAVNENATWCAENVPVGDCPAPGSVVADTSGSTTAYNCITPNSTICTGGTLNGTDCIRPVATACTGTLGVKVSTSSDTRTIKTANSTGTALTDFNAAYATANPANFAAAHINTLSQWALLSAAQQTAAAGVNLINFLRGQYGYEDRTTNALTDRLYRYREAVLGDALESQPAFISKPVFGYPYPGYSQYVTDQTARAGTVFMGANDGMMHAFAADSGIERWAYVPSMVIPNMWMLADKNYSTSHRNFVNGSPIISDICSANCADIATAVWKTILVGGLNGGGRGYYALDITIPDAPVLLWEFTPATDSDLGYSFGQPVITRKADGTWVVLVTSGYDNGTLSSDPLVNNSPAGSGKGYLYVLNAVSGAIISKITTDVGTATTPSGLAKIAGWNNEPGGNSVGYVYGGDLQGNVWRFDINSTAAAVIGTGDKMQLAILKDYLGNTQPITTTPVLGKIVGKRVIFVGTGKYLETGDLTNTQRQTQYAIKDDDATTTLVNPRTTLVNQTLTANPDGTASRINSSTNEVNFYTGRGWYVDFPDNGERANIDSKLVEGTLLVPTIVPSSTVCTPGGYGWLNFLDYKTGGVVKNPENSLVASIKYDSTIVGVNVLYIQGQPKVGVVTSTNPTPELNPYVKFKTTSPTFQGKRVIWRELIPQ